MANDEITQAEIKARIKYDELTKEEIYFMYVHPVESIAGMTIHQRLLCIQEEIKVPKSHSKPEINYAYRTAEDIMNAVKPLCRKYGCVITINDDTEQYRSGYQTEKWVNGKKEFDAVLDTGVIVIKAEAKIMTIDGSDDTALCACASAAVTLNRKGMDNAQSFGSSSSYARKYALGGLLLLDDEKDPDDKEVDKDDKGTNDKPKAPEKAKTPVQTPKPKIQAVVNPIAEAITNYYNALPTEKQEATLAAINRYKKESNVKTIGELSQDKLQELYQYVKDVNEHTNP